jgi:hypothetical protein
MSIVHIFLIGVFGLFIVSNLPRACFSSEPVLYGLHPIAWAEQQHWQVVVAVAAAAAILAVAVAVAAV